MLTELAGIFVFCCHCCACNRSLLGFEIAIINYFLKGCAFEVSPQTIKFPGLPNSGAPINLWSMNPQEPQINQTKSAEMWWRFVEKLWSLWSPVHANPQMRLTHVQPQTLIFLFFFLLNVFKAHATDLNRLLKQFLWLFIA